MDYSLWALSAFAQAGMAVLGFWLTLSPSLATNHPKTLVIAIAVLTVVALGIGLGICTLFQRQ